MNFRQNIYSIIMCSALMCFGSVNISQAELRDNSPRSTAIQGNNVVDTTSHLKSAKRAWIKPRQIRCWQQGRLIVEENDWYLKKIGEQASFSKGNNQVLYMFNFSDTFCIYRKGDDGK